MSMYLRSVARLVSRFVHDQDGPTATEYAVMLSLILMTAIGAIGIFGGTLNDLFVTIESTLFTTL